MRVSAGSGLSVEAGSILTANGEDFRARLAAIWARRARLERAAVIGVPDNLMPPVERRDAATASPGMAGPLYAPGNTVILSVNPAGGRDTYVASDADKAMYAAFRRLRDAGEADLVGAFEAANAALLGQMPGWTVYRQHTSRVLSALGIGLAQIGYVYVVPFRTKGDRAAVITADIEARAWETGLAEQLGVMAPSRIVALDRASERCARRYAADHTVKVWYWTRKRDAHARRDETYAEMAATAGE